MQKHLPTGKDPKKMGLGKYVPPRDNLVVDHLMEPGYLVWTTSTWTAGASSPLLSVSLPYSRSVAFY